MARQHIRHLSLMLLGSILFTAPLPAQQVVHALTGTVTALDPAAKTIAVNTDDGTEGSFTTSEQTGTTLDFSKSVRSASVPAASFTRTNAKVLVYYIGDNSVRTAIALEDLGNGPFVKTTGTITKMDHHAHTIVLKTDAGDQQTFTIDDKTVAEASNGVEEGLKFHADKGTKVRIIASKTASGQTAHFIRALTPDF